MTNVKSIMMAVAVVSAFAFVGCSDVEMQADESPSPETPDNYNVDIKEPTNGSVFDDLYVYGQIGHRHSVTFKIRNVSEHPVHDIKMIRHGGKDVIAPSSRTDTFEYESYGFELTAPYKDDITERRYRLKALNETGHVVDAVNVTITDNGGSSGLFQNR